MGLYEIGRNGLFMYFYLEKGEEAKLLGISSKKMEISMVPQEGACRIVDVIAPARKNYSFRGAKTFYDEPAYVFAAEEFGWKDENCFEIVQRSEEGQLLAKTIYAFAQKAPAVSCKSILENRAERPVAIDGITSFCLGALDYYVKGVSDPSNELELYYAHNTWSEECRWIHGKLKDRGIRAYGNLCYDRFRIGNHSGFSTGEYLPMGAVYHTQKGETVLWQVESSGAWAWEIGCSIPGYQESFLKKEYRQQIYLQLFGPDMESAGWYKALLPGERFETVEASVVCSSGTPEEAIGALTIYRRQKRQIRELPVIFNDYMNCFMGDSTTQKLLPLIDKAAEAGCEIFVVDCGWYDAGSWQYTFGEFKECKERYPGGLREVTDYIRKKGMKPGIWLELESVGIDSRAIPGMPREWFFSRHGEPVVDSGRMHLDFRVKEVRERASAILERVLTDYRIGYVKIDYNLGISFGTEREADSAAEGMLQHNRAYLGWLLEEKRKYREVIFENCGSGGLRMDNAMLSRMDIQSVSDQEDYRIMAMIASNCASAVLPEQAGIWSYPMQGSSREECVMNMVSAMLFRVHLGGNLDQLSEEGFGAVKEGIACYKEIRSEIPEGIPFWPLGFHDFDAEWLAWGLHGENRDLIAVCRRNAGEDTLQIPVREGMVSARVLYPLKEPTAVLEANGEEGAITVKLEKEYSAGVIAVVYRKK